MDTELFQILSLVLLLAVVALLAVAVSSLGKLRKTVETSSAAGPQLGETPAPETAEAERPRAEERPAEEAAPEPEPEPVGVEPRGAAGEPVAGAAATAGAEARAEPAATDTFAAASQQPEPAAAEPQEQPFERDGRWWFRRGDELLVYDEQTGQWMPAPESAPQPVGAPSPAAGQETGTATQEAAGGFWKCPSCGAVNGSTATSCRMCFAARP